MLQLIYISTARNVGPADVEVILTESRRNNGRDGITGLLLFNGSRFLQALEGPDDRVRSTYDRIKKDPRHWAAVTLSTRQVSDRQFGSWQMACEQTSRHTDGLDLAEAVDAIVADVADLNMRALFSSYARLKAVS